MTWAYTIETGTMETQPLQETACWETTTTAENRVELCYNWNRYYDPGLGMYTQVDRIVEISGGRFYEFRRLLPDFLNTYLYTGGNPAGRIDWNGLFTDIIVTRDNEKGNGLDYSHAAVRIDNNGSPQLFDPGGSYKAIDKEGYPYRPSDNLFEGYGADLEPFIDYHSRMDGSKPIVVRFNTSAAEEAEISKRLGGGGPLACAFNVSTALSGIGPFKDLGWSVFPGSLLDDLLRIQRGK